MEEKQVYIGSISYQIGNVTAIEDIEDIDHSIKKGMRIAGLESISVEPNRDLLKLAENAIRKTMELSKIKAEDIDIVIFSTASYWKINQLTPEAIGQMLVENGLKSSELFMCSILSCVNSAVAIRSARNFILSENVENVLVVNVDVAAPGDRLVYGNTSLLSDAASSCVVSTLKSEFELLAVSRKDAHSLYEVTQNREVHLVAKINRMFEEIKASVDVFLDSNQINRSDINVFIANNYSKFISKYTIEQLELQHTKTYVHNIERLGHAFSADNIINLCDMNASGKLLDGDVILTLATGLQNFGTMLLRKLGE